MEITQNQHLKFLITIDAADAEIVDTAIMRSGIAQALEFARNEGLLTAIDNETTQLGPFSVISPPNAADSLFHILAPNLEDTPAARRAIELAITSITRKFARDNINVLTSDERQHLVDGIALERKKREKSGEEWISDIVHHGYDGYADEADIVLLENAFCDNPIFSSLVDDSARLAVLRILTKPEVIDVICSPERINPVIDLDEFDREIQLAVDPMAASNRTSRHDDTLEALQLQGMILSLLEQRLDGDDMINDSERPRG